MLSFGFSIRDKEAAGLINKQSTLTNQLAMQACTQQHHRRPTIQAANLVHTLRSSPRTHKCSSVRSRYRKQQQQPGQEIKSVMKFTNWRLLLLLAVSTSASEIKSSNHPTAEHRIHAQQYIFTDINIQPRISLMCCYWWPWHFFFCVKSSDKELGS